MFGLSDYCPKLAAFVSGPLPPVVAFPTSPVLTPDLVLGPPGQVARFEFSKTTKKNVRQHGRRADVTFVE